MHIALLEDDHNPLAALPAFGEFVSAINERCASGPTPVNGTVVGAYGIAGLPGAGRGGRAGRGGDGGGIAAGAFAGFESVRELIEHGADLAAGVQLRTPRGGDRAASVLPG